MEYARVSSDKAVHYGATNTLQCVNREGIVSKLEKTIDLVGWMWPFTFRKNHNVRTFSHVSPPIHFKKSTVNLLCISINGCHNEVRLRKGLLKTLLFNRLKSDFISFTALFFLTGGVSFEVQDKSSMLSARASWKVSSSCKQRIGQDSNVHSTWFLFTKRNETKDRLKWIQYFSRGSICVF